MQEGRKGLKKRRTSKRSTAELSSTGEQAQNQGERTKRRGEYEQALTSNGKQTMAKPPYPHMIPIFKIALNTWAMPKKTFGMTQILHMLMIFLMNSNKLICFQMHPYCKSDYTSYAK